MTQLDPDAKRDIIGRISIFGDLAPAEIDALVPVARTLRVKARAEVFHKGDEGTQVYIVTAGKLKALTTSSEGDDVVFAILGPSDVFGEIGLFGSPKRTATITALDPCELLVIDRRDFLAFLRAHPDVAIKLLRVLAERVKNTNEFIEDTLFLNLPLRLAKKLMSLAMLYGTKKPDGIHINLKLSQEEWGDLVGATRESINKQMRAWGEDGFIRIEKGYVVIQKPEELERLAGFLVF